MEKSSGKIGPREQKPQVKNCYAEDKLIQPFRTRAGRFPCYDGPPLQTNFNRQTDTRNALRKKLDGKYLKFKGAG